MVEVSGEWRCVTKCENHGVTVGAAVTPVESTTGGASEAIDLMSVTGRLEGRVV